MFADPVSNLMLIILLFFAGLLVMFIFILRSLEMSAQNHEETRRQLSISLSDLERKVAELAFAMRDKGLIDPENMPDSLSGGRQASGQDLDDLTSLFDKFSVSEADGNPDSER